MLIMLKLLSVLEICWKSHNSKNWFLKDVLDKLLGSKERLFRLSF